MIKDYLVNNDGGSILSEFEKTNGLSDLTRKHLITKIAYFIIELFGPIPNKQQKKKFSMAVIQLFPILETKNSDSGGIVSIQA